MIKQLNLITEGKWQGYVSVYESEVKLPVTIIQGETKGETLLITSGIHCAEYVGIEAVMELAQELDAKELQGTLILVHPVNVSGFEQSSYNSSVPEDGKNLNRVFPGDKNGTLSEQIADFIVTEFQQKADYYIDVHGGNTQEDLSPYVYYVTVAKPNVMEKAREMANRMDVSYMVGSKVGSQGSYNHAGASGIPSILIERGCKGVWSKEEVMQYKEDIKNVMRYLGILKDGIEDKNYHPKEMETVYYAEAKVGGCWYPTKKAGEQVKKGELAGEIKDYFQNTLHEVYFEVDGVILYQTCSLCIRQGEEVVTYAKI